MYIPHSNERTDATRVPEYVRMHDTKWSYGVTVSTLDSESSDRGSNPRRTLLKHAEQYDCVRDYVARLPFFLRRQTY
jgi:hypothetical protein